MPISIGLAVYAMVLAAILTFTFGLLAAVNKGSWIDQLIRVVFLFVLTTPNFWFGILLILVLSLGLHWFPVAGFGTTFTEHIWYLFLPALTLALQLSAVLIRNLRSSVISAMRLGLSCAPRAPRACSSGWCCCGTSCATRCSRRSRIFGLQFGFLIGGALVDRDGLRDPRHWASCCSRSITSRDYPVVQAITVVTALMVILVNLIVDLSYSFLDPRVTYG